MTYLLGVVPAVQHTPDQVGASGVANTRLTGSKCLILVAVVNIRDCVSAYIIHLDMIFGAGQHLIRNSSCMLCIRFVNHQCHNGVSSLHLRCLQACNSGFRAERTDCGTDVLDSGHYFKPHHRSFHCYSCWM